MHPICLALRVLHTRVSQQLSEDIRGIADELRVPVSTERPPKVGERIRVWPAHVDPTVAKHERLHIVRDDTVLESWAVDLRGW